MAAWSPPGIVAGEAGLQPGQACWVRDQWDLRPLAVGLALAAGAEMPKDAGMKVKNAHRVGDGLWAFAASLPCAGPPRPSCPS